MFTKNTQVAWATKTNTFMGKVVKSSENFSVIIVTSTAKGTKHDGKRMIVRNRNLGDITNGRTVTARA